MKTYPAPEVVTYNVRPTKKGFTIADLGELINRVKTLVSEGKRFVFYDETSFMDRRQRNRYHRKLKRALADRESSTSIILRNPLTPDDPRISNQVSA